MINLRIPIAEEQVIQLKVGDKVSLNGVLVTARDVAHKYIVGRLLQEVQSKEDERLFGRLKKYLHEGVVYHCGPVVKKEVGGYTFLAAGPTTSMREEPYESDVIEHFGLRGMIGKGGMGDKTLAACLKNKAVYFHAVGGAAVLLGGSVREVLGVECLHFGTPEAFWIIRVEDFPCVVTMDSHGQSLHKTMIEKSHSRLKNILDI